MPMTVEDILSALQAIVDGARDDDGAERDLSDEEAARYEQLEVQLATARRTDEIRRRHAAYGTVTPPVRPSAGPRDDSQVLERAFTEWVKTGHENADVVELRAQSEGTGSAGGYLVPTTLLNRLTDRMKAFGGLERVAEVMSTASGESSTWPTLDDTANEGEIVNEGAAPASGADLVFGKRELGAYRFSSVGTGGNPLRISQQLLTDSAFNIEGLVLAKLGERIARHAAPKFVRGTGANEPEGITHGCTVSNGRAIEIAADTNGVTYDDLITFIHSVDPAYRESGTCHWAFNDTSLKTIKLIKDSNGDPIWRPLDADMSTSTGGGVLMGYPVLIDQAFVDIDVDDNTDLWGVFGNIKEGLVIRNSGGVVVIRDPYTRAKEWEVEFTAHARKDSIQNEKNAYVCLTGEQ
jgi:HK97 family phage major capsid protein